MPTNNPNIVFGKHSYGDIQIVGRTVADIAQILCSPDIARLREWAKKNGKI